MSEKKECLRCGISFQGHKHYSTYCDSCADDIVNDKELRSLNLKKQYEKMNEEAEEADRRYEDRNVRGMI